MRRERGFTYIGLLLAVALMGTALAAAGTLWHTQMQRDRERELLFVGEQFRQAIASYAEKAPAGSALVLPRSFDDLLDDKRWPTQRRHLRKLFVDPMTGTRDWGVVAGPGGSIAGVYSRGEGKPFKRARFAEAQAEFADAASYRDWRFVYTPGSATTKVPPR